ncbi:SLATT domain-containing protein [Vallitalea guaymasensis]|uniref:SLATT domain-containing protein n=1 Tax=Vallitalea guaymasensis TaxID=1185412 RepID=A0A8J8M9Q4_9FIRM|nr:SLATT domain-containing protein [Vallitalea guaymasensis]QUH28710.1 SLATT domain-containing protein [Vallitalea guaymasensis]
MDKNIYDDLENRIYLTRAARICAAERCKSWSHFLNVLTIWYSISIIVFSILNMINTTKPEYISVSLLAFSVIAFGVPVISNKLNYEERFKKHKHCYIILYNLYLELAYKQNKTPQVLNDIQKRYIELLQQYENHNNFDYIKSIWNNKQQKIKLCSKIKFVLYSGFVIVIKGILLVLPIVIPCIFEIIMSALKII